MAVPRKDTPSLSPLSINQPDRGGESIRSEKPSGIPVPSRATNVAATGLRPASTSPPARSNSVSHRFLSPTEWARVAHGVGAIREGETHAVVHPTCWYWPPKGLPDGLYRDVIFQKIKNHYCYHLLSTLRWILMVIQIIIGAVLTALGSLSKDNSVPIMVLAAINTVTAGLLALMHNSGLPDRYRMNKVQFDNVEDFLRVGTSPLLAVDHGVVAESLALTVMDI